MGHGVGGGQKTVDFVKPALAVPPANRTFNQAEACTGFRSAETAETGRMHWICRKQNGTEET